MGSMRRRTVIALVGTTVLGMALAACGGSGSSGGGTGAGAGAGAGAGKTLHVLVGPNTQFPQENQAWQLAISAMFKAQTGANVQWETYNSANDELTKIETSVVSGSGPDVYGVGTTFTPTAYATTRAGSNSAARTSSFPRRSGSPDPTTGTRSAFPGPPARS
jgi:multiple sugar transport system substrate-binding protein